MKKGFATSAIIYTLLLLFLVLLVGILSNAQNRKTILDQLKNDTKQQLENVEETPETLCKYEVGKEWSFAYKGSPEEFKVPCNGTYKIELWGAAGGMHVTQGLGSYVSGKIDFVQNFKLYVYVGGKGNECNSSTAGGYNGGGNSSKSSNNTNNASGPSGGGATDVRLVSGSWDDFDSLKSRIMVAAGGGGGSSASGSEYLGSGGGLTGYDGCITTLVSYERTGKGGTQTLGGKIPTKYPDGQSNGSAGTFGSGGTGGANASTSTWGGGSGAGSGYYGGSGSSGVSNGSNPGGGGSSFISGHKGCNAIAETSTETNIVHTNQPNHYSGYTFTDTIMIDGMGYQWTTSKQSKIDMPTQDGKSKMVGNSDDGYAKITLVSINNS